MLEQGREGGRHRTGSFPLPSTLYIHKSFYLYMKIVSKRLNDLSQIPQELLTQLSLELLDHCSRTFLLLKAPSGVWWYLR